MTLLEDALKPINDFDSHVLKQYTKVVKKLKLDKGKRRFYTGLILNEIGNGFIKDGLSHLIGPGAANFSGFFISFPDWLYNVKGIFGGNPEEKIVSDVMKHDPVTKFYRKYNSFWRAPLIAGSLLSLGKFGVELSRVSESGELGLESYAYLNLGIGLLSLGSSMYIKEFDPKLLRKDSVFDKVTSWWYENIPSLLPKAAPQTVRGYENLETEVSKE